MTKPPRVAIMLDLDWPYKRHARVFAGIQRYAQEGGWISIMDEYVDDTLSRCRPRQVPYDGIIARATGKVALHAARLKIPLVNVWYSSPVRESLPGVFPDYPTIGRLRAEHLLSRGLVRFAALISQGNRAQAAEQKAFVAAVEQAGGQWVSGILPVTRSVRSWRMIEREIADSMNGWTLPIGVYVGPERSGRHLAQMCHNRGWRVPEDVAIIAGHNEETFCEGLRPTLTSIEIGFEQVGYAAATLLDQVMDGKVPPEKHIWLPPIGLVIRESTDFFTVGDKSVAAALKFIAENSHKPIGRRDVARAVGVETMTLQRRFRKYLNRPIATEIRRVRIERAKRELAQGERSLKEIAAAVGFGDAMRMYEVFRRELGVTPSHYRRERQIRPPY